MPDNALPDGLAQRTNVEFVLDSVNAAIISIDRHGNVLEANNATSRLFGHPHETMIGSNVSMLMPEPYRREHDGYLSHHLRTGERRIIGKGRNVQGLHANGTIFPIHLAVGRDEVGGEIRFTGIIRNLTTREHSEEDVLRLGRIVDESLNEIYVFDAETLKYSLVNRGALANLGYSPEEMRTMTPLDVSPEIDAVELAALIAPLHQHKRDRIRFQGTHQRKDGSQYEVEVMLHLSDAVSPSEFVAIVQDVTDRNRIDRALGEAQKMESIGQLTGGIAHDFNNLLTVISGNLELLDMQLADVDARELLDEARDAASMGARLTSRLLTFASRSTLAPVTVHPNTLILDMTEMLRRTLGERIVLATRLDPDAWSIRVDVSQLENALLNMALNARDAMPEGGRLTIATHNRKVIATERDVMGNLLPDCVDIVVTDTGCGIQPQDLPRLYEPFFTTRKHRGGSGLGLSMVYGFARQCGGRIDAVSTVGEGASFTLSLPRLRQPRTRMQSAEVDTEGSDLCLNVLVVEDEESVRRLLVRRLRHLGHVVIEAANGDIAMSLFIEHANIDVVLSDVVMPGLRSGLDVAREIRQIDADVGILLTSGYADELVDDLSMQALSDVPMLKKPYPIETLRAALATVMKDR